MYRCNDKEYNLDPWYEGEKSMVTVTIDQLIESLAKAKSILGGDTVVMIAGDMGSNYGEIRSIHGENFHGNLVCTLNACNAKKDPSADMRTMLYQQNDFEE